MDCRIRRKSGGKQS